MNADGFWQGSDFYSALQQTDPNNFVWILAQDYAILQALQQTIED
jgi:hypothetical protein